MIEILFLVLAAGIFGCLFGIVAVFCHVRDNYMLYKLARPCKHCKNIPFLIKTLHVIKAAADCKLCGETVSVQNSQGINSCGCGNLTVESTPTSFIIYARNIEQVFDKSVVAVETFVQSGK